MFTAYVIVTLMAAALVALASGGTFAHATWVVEPLSNYGVPRSWWPWLATAKAAGAAGLLVGLFVPVIGVMAGIGLVVYFIGAVITVVRSRWYTMVRIPLIYMASVVAALTLRLSA
jgi:hypothetical protein